MSEAKQGKGPPDPTRFFPLFDFAHVQADLNTATNMLMRHLPLPLPMDTNSNDERNILSGGATMPVP